MRILDIAFKDILQIFRDRKSLLFLVAMPVVFTLFMGAASAGAVEPEDNRLTLAWVNEDPQGVLSQDLFQRLSGSQALNLIPLESGEAERELSNGAVSGVLIVPEGFSEGVLSGKQYQLTLLAEPLSNTGQALYGLLRVPITQVMSSVEISRLSLEAIDSRAPFASAAEAEEERQAAFAAAAQAWTDIDQQAEWVVVEKAVREPEALPLGGNPYNQASPGILVQFAIFSLTTSAQILTQERKTRTLQRLMTTAARTWEIIAGHLLAMFLLVFLQTLLLVLFGQAALNVNYLHSPLATLMLSVTLALWVAGLGLLIGVISKGEEQVILFSMLAMFLFSALGGCWFPLEGVGQTFAAIGKLTPSAWAMTGYQNLLIRGLGLNSAWTAAGIQSLYALGFFLLALWRFRAGQ